MALPKNIQQSVFTPAEIEFISEYEQITILPLQRMEAISLLEVSCLILSFKQLINNKIYNIKLNNNNMQL